MIRGMDGWAVRRWRLDAIGRVRGVGVGGGGLAMEAASWLDGGGCVWSGVVLRWAAFGDVRCKGSTLLDDLKTY